MSANAVPNLSSGSVTNNWPNKKTAVSSVSIAVNIACIILKSSKLVTLGLNVPSRVFSIIIHYKEPYKVALEVAALSVLLLPYGSFLSIAIDATSEVIFYIRNKERNSSTLEVQEPSSVRAEPRSPSTPAAEELLASHAAEEPASVRVEQRSPVTLVAEDLPPNTAGVPNIFSRGLSFLSSMTVTKSPSLNSSTTLATMDTGSASTATRFIRPMHAEDSSKKAGETMPELSSLEREAKEKVKKDYRSLPAARRLLRLPETGSVDLTMLDRAVNDRIMLHKKEIEKVRGKGIGARLHQNIILDLQTAFETVVTAETFGRPRPAE